RDDGRRDCVRATARPTAARVLWSVHTLVLVTALLAGTVAFRAQELADRHCSSSPLSANRDTRLLKADKSADPECVGIATGDVRFSDWLKSGDHGGTSAKAPWTLAELEKKIERENAGILSSKNAKYVTVVYAGPLGSASPENASPVKGIEELAGVYLAQAAINKAGSPRLRVLIANGGADMRHQVAMAESIARYARRDPSLVGVVGAGRNLTTSKDVATLLGDAELPVISGTNSSTELPLKHANWFSLAAPDAWQARQLELIARQLQLPKTEQHALVLARDTKKTQDEYTNQQARFGGEMLKGLRYKVTGPVLYTVQDGRAELQGPTETFCRGTRVPSVIYFAGRAEDINPLMQQLSAERGCDNRNISILTGDDLSKADFTSQGNQQMPADVTLYYAALAYPADGQSTNFYRNAEQYLSPAAPAVRPGWARPRASLLASGQTALSYDATRALHKAASVGGAVQNRAATWVNLRTVDLPNMATGTIDFTDAQPRANRTGHSIVLNEVRTGRDAKPVLRALCGRAAGDARPLTAADCSIGREPLSVREVGG
ncbi:ABC transporter substrate-binding protein, partial [Streptomyces sp. NPDC006798]|uniref:ABC transporter substrate-binding protein n=1 Tax=Streptomyces sp. NPDC006798 TaxID=3155462 RepID=UPI00340F720D